MKRILDNRPCFILPDDGLSIIPYGYTDNLAHALLLAVDHPEASMGEIFNCGDDEKLTIRQMVEIITDELGHQWELLSLPGHLAIPARPLMQNYRSTHRYIDTTKLRDRLGYRDVVPARQAVRRAANWLVANPPERGGYEGDRTPGPFRLCRRGPPGRVVACRRGRPARPRLPRAAGLRKVLCRTWHPCDAGRHPDMTNVRLDKDRCHDR